jgi:hypothetical protein
MIGDSGETSLRLKIFLVQGIGDHYPIDLRIIKEYNYYAAHITVTILYL